MSETVKDIVDTNVLLRFLVGDEPRQQAQARQWFKEAESGKRMLVVVPLVVAESCFVLETFYKKPRQEIASAFEVLLSQRWLAVEDRDVLLGLWSHYCQGLHFVDSFLLAKARVRKGRVLTFDVKLGKKNLE